MSEEKYKLIVDDHFEKELNRPDIDVVRLDDKTFHVLKNGKSHKAKIIATDFDAKFYIIELDGKQHKVKIKDQHDLLVDELGLAKSSEQQMNDVKAPMPGLVLEVEVKVGQKVQKGDGLLILEAMKMENVIKSTGEGVVKDIHISKGAAVDKGQLLIEME